MSFEPLGASATRAPLLAPDDAGTVTWVHIGDLHAQRPGDESDERLARIVADLARRFATGVAFAFLPGDNANEGRPEQYAAVRRRLAELPLPWLAIVGDHDVHEGTDASVRAAMAPRPTQAFDVGAVRVVALDAFDGSVPDDPRAFAVGERQLRWLEEELAVARRRDRTSVVFLHCYPSDLAHGAARLSEVVREGRVRVLEMGHTHYNELANDGTTLYVATRSTGQIEEGPPGFSLTTVDGGSVSWRFVPLGERTTVVITSPTDARLARDDEPEAASTTGAIRVRAKVWSDEPLADLEVVASIGAPGEHAEPATVLARLGTSHVFEGVVPADGRRDGRVTEIRVRVRAPGGSRADDAVRLTRAGDPRPGRAPRDQDNDVGPWPAHAILGTQLGPNKNGRGW